MKLVHRAHVLCVSFILLPVLALAPTWVVAQQTQERVQKRGQINIGYRDDASPFSLLGPGNAPMGYSLEFCKPVVDRLLKAIGKADTRIKYIPVPVDQVLRSVESGSVDLMCSGTSDTAERRQQVAFSPPIYVASTKMLVKAGDSAKSVKDLGGKSVVLIGRTTAEEAVRLYGEKTSTLWRVARALNPEAAIGQLDLGWVSAYARDDVLLASQISRLPKGNDYRMLPEALSTEYIALAYQKDDAAMDRVVLESFVSLVRDGAAHELYDKWFMKPIPNAKRALGLPMSNDLKDLWSTVK
jgi:glutamate/aspartate transport system substrate-binding protein